jgi:AcrR family transcriptional regulator
MGVYTWFGGKDGLVEAMWLDGFRGLGRALTAVAGGGAPRRRIVRLINAYRDWALAHPTHYQLMFGRAVPEFEPGPELLNEAASGTFSILVEAVTAAQSSRQLRPGNPGQLALYVWGLAHGLVMIELSGVVPPQAQGDPRRAYRLAIDALLAGLTP